VWKPYGLFLLLDPLIDVGTLSFRYVRSGVLEKREELFAREIKQSIADAPLYAVEDLF
jgi:hypothetical protein